MLYFSFGVRGVWSLGVDRGLVLWFSAVGDDLMCVMKTDEMKMMNYNEILYNRLEQKGKIFSTASILYTSLRTLYTVSSID